MACESVCLEGGGGSRKRDALSATSCTEVGVRAEAGRPGPMAASPRAVRVCPSPGGIAGP